MVAAAACSERAGFCFTNKIYSFAVSLISNGWRDGVLGREEGREGGKEGERGRGMEGDKEGEV